MLEFLSSIFTSLFSNFIYSLYGSEKKANDPKVFESRAEVFHSKIAPYLINELLPKQSPKVHSQLAIHTIHNGPIKRLPYINLFRGGDFHISKYLSESKSDLPKDENFIRWLKMEIGKRVDNNPTFRLIDYNRNGKINIGIGDYESTVSTSDKKYFDLIRYFPENTRLHKLLAYKYDRHVKEWIQSLERIVLKKSFDHYTASIGCSVLTVMRRENGEYAYLIKENSRKKSSAAAERHVVPSFMFQPVSVSASEQEKEIDLNFSVLREYGEELLSIPEAENGPSLDTLENNLYKNSFLKKLAAQLKSNEAVLEVTGLSVDIFRLRPEITFLLILHDPVFSKNLKPNWEVRGGKVDHVPLESESRYNEIIHDNSNPLCPPGLAALINGRDLALKLLNHHS